MGLNSKSRLTVASTLLLLTTPAGLLFGLPDTASAWKVRAHIQITLDALSVLPPSVQEVLQPQEDWLRRGSLAPDLEPRYAGDHSLNPDGTGSAHILLKHYAKEAEELIRQKASWSKIAYAMGKAAHLIQDLNQPQHTDTGEGSGAHQAYEAIAYLSGWPRPGTKDGYDGFDHIRDYAVVAYQTASWSRQYFSVVGSGPVIAATWNHAVNDTADLWLSILQNAHEKGTPTVDLPTPLRVQKIQKRGCLFAAVLKDTRYAGLLEPLRHFRDTHLRASVIGRYLIVAYYELSDLVLPRGGTWNTASDEPLYPIPDSLLFRADKVIR